MGQPQSTRAENTSNAQPATPHNAQQRKAAMQKPAGGIISPEELATRWLKQPYPPTPQQSAVISAPPQGSYIVVAGAGAGKTETMAARVVWLVANGFVLPEHVLGLTFTRKAANELGQRIRGRLETLARSGFREHLPADDPRHEALRNISPAVSTYDSYAGNIVGEYGLLAPVEPSGRIISDAEKWMITRQLLIDHDRELTTSRSMNRMIEFIHTLSEEMDNHLADLKDVRGETEALIDTFQQVEHGVGKPLSLKAYELRDANQERLDLLPWIPKYWERLKELDVRTFGQQMTLAAKLVSEHPIVGQSQRERFRVVMLDEYQDTSHAQRVLLRSLFGDGQDDQLAVTAVGDPMQAIYGFRGATSSNLGNFEADFPFRGQPAQKLELTTSWRNPASVLDLANVVSSRTLGDNRTVSELKPREGADDGDIQVAFFDEEDQELEWLTDQLQQRWESFKKRKEAAAVSGEKINPFSAAVLVRKNKEALPIFELLRAKGVPVELTGGAGLLDIPEVADVYATLRALVDPEDDPAMLRLLTGPRFNLGARDLQILARRAQQLQRRAKGDTDPGEMNQAADSTATSPGAEDPWIHNPAYEELKSLESPLREQLLDAIPNPADATVGLADAIADFADAEEQGMSPQGTRAIAELSRELGHLRRNCLTKPLPDLIADIEDMIGIRTEVLTRWHRNPDDSIGTSHLDKFAEIVQDFSRLVGSNASALVDYLRAAHEHDAGLEPGEVEAKTDTVQILTVHRSKGLEWDIVAVPYAHRKNFYDAEAPGITIDRWISKAELLPSSLRGDAETEGEPGGYPIYDISHAEKSVDLTNAAEAFRAQLLATEAQESERLFYVGITRTERVLLVSGAAYRPGNDTALDPSLNLVLLKNRITDARAPLPGASVHTWSDLGRTPSKKDAARVDKGKATEIDHYLYPTAEQLTAREDYAATRHTSAAEEQASWPQPAPLASRPGAAEGASMVVDALGAATTGDPASQSTANQDMLTRQWDEETRLLIQEHQQRTLTAVEVPLDPMLTATQAVAMNQDPEQFARRRRRPIPMQPQPYAKRGTAFHNWVEQHYNQAMLFDEDEMPGASDATLQDPQLEELKNKFLGSEWAQRTPESVEGSYLVNIGGFVFNGRMDAVFHEGDDPAAGWLVVDWKTGQMPTGRDMRNAELQLAAYRLAWAKILSRQLGVGVPVDNVRTAFFYVRTQHTHYVQDLPNEEELIARLGLDKS
ncbi:UvrD-helicase domain-containing protein [Corynebacterium sp. MSK039]|uniref:UvrD-helicase domain-containing protein n=1 Tax=Corynebacterium sp. MSK039 TaxID=3050193 RepID=UPI00254ED6A4|nr:UvrD-helicase domain-containing protein [Corynebacterium sp. MSK039]MDK8790506.1 UvrD-helicase domain-containing protein [Corynebacterium sp. MSK039]